MVYEPATNGHPGGAGRRSVAIVGGGFGGVGAAVLLRRAGFHDVTVFERGERVGGVWHHNTYPGAACDVPSHLYEFSFAPNPRWSRRYAPQAEIQAYLEDVARRYGVSKRIKTGVEVARASWDEDAARWTLQTSAGEHQADREPLVLERRLRRGDDDEPERGARLRGRTGRGFGCGGHEGSSRRADGRWARRRVRAGWEAAAPGPAAAGRDRGR